VRREDPDVNDVAARARAWLAVDPDGDTRAELEGLLARGDEAQLSERFDGRLQFGTAGLRGELGAGPMRMNRVVVRQAAAGLCRWLLDRGEADRGLVIGYDARHKSDVFAEDTARVAAGSGVRARLLPGPLPTPVLAFAVTETHAAAGVMVTASHNPPRDNGYKVYTVDGAQIVSPIDAEISAAIDTIDIASIELADVRDPLVERLGDDVVDAYVRHVPSVRQVPDVGDVTVAYTPIHGVGGAIVSRAFEEAGLPAASATPAQAKPDPDFPTVPFPNPEEPGAMDLLLAHADAIGADIAIANDPDADRVGVAVPARGGGWRVLRGDEIGWLLGDHILRHTSGDDRLVVTTLVSSSLLGEMAIAAGVHYAETFTGFKWIARAVLERPELRFVFGYEQALGYLVTDRPLDKDGVTAAVVMAEIAAAAKRDGVTVLDRLDDLARRFGRHVTAERSLRMEPAAGEAAVASLRAAPPSTVAGRAVTDVQDYPEANLLRLQCGRARVQVRPSGTEPKVKVYGEAIDEDPMPLIDAVAALLVS
jgi:phosphomannomutase